MSQFPSACYKCGQPGHYAADCPDTKPHSSGTVVPPPLPPRRPASQVADASAWAAKIRADMGWSKGRGVLEEPGSGNSWPTPAIPEVQNPAPPQHVEPPPWNEPEF